MAGGQPTKLNKSIIDELAHYIKRGVAIKYAAPASGISEDCFHRWMANGREDKQNDETTLAREFYETISKIRAEFIQEAIDNIKKAGRTNKNWQANSWLLEKLYSAAYGKDTAEVQKLSQDIEEIKRILGADADPVNHHNETVGD